ncbi:Branched-chain amino acid transport system substrate-binding protein [Azospirillaceae bacterium]
MRKTRIFRKTQAPTLFAVILSMAALLLSGLEGARADDVSVKIGVLTDMKGLYGDVAGVGSTVAAKMAVEDFKAGSKGIKVELLEADHMNKADVGSQIARDWFDQQGVDIIVDSPNSTVAFAVSQIAREKNKIFIGSGAGSSDLTGKLCSPNTIHWTYDTWSVANGAGLALMASGGDEWYFLTADYAFGVALERDAMSVVMAKGGKIKGTSRVPLNVPDFSHFTLQAQDSGAKVIALAMAGGDFSNAVKSAYEFGVVAGGQKLAGLLVFITDVHALSLEVAQGLQFVEAFYWDANEQTRAFTRRFIAQGRGGYPTMIHAGVYSSVLHYLKAIDAARGDRLDGAKIVAKMKEIPTDDPVMGKGSIRIDGRKLHDLYLFEVKKPIESKKPWDYYKIIKTIPAAEAFRPLSLGGCPLAQ